MALFIRQDKGRSELQTKVESDLKERLKARALEPQEEHESTILENQHQTNSTGVLITLVVVGLCVLAAWWLLNLAGIF